MLKYLLICNHYGIKPAFCKKGGFSAREKQIRESKMDIINMCDQMMAALKYIEKQVKESPESGNDMYIEKITDFQSRVKIVNKKMEEMLVVDNK